MTQSTKNIVLVHGGFVDGSGWESVYSLLKKDGYNVAIVQNPTISLAGDVAATKLVINEQDGPVILVGHSYGGGLEEQAKLVPGGYRRQNDSATGPAFHGGASGIDSR